MAAHQITQRRRYTQRKLIRHPELCQRVVNHLKDGWTPEQIGKPDDLDGAKQARCQETIYRYIYSKRRHVTGLVVVPAHASQEPDTPPCSKASEIKFDRDVSILFRPDDVAHRRQFGHWEGDLMLFEQRTWQANVTSLVERVSRFTVILKNPNKRTKPVMGKILKAIKDLPHIARRSITFDRGSEFRQLAAIAAKNWYTNLRSAIPRHPGKKERLKNTNRRARRWLTQKARYTSAHGSRHQRNKRPPQQHTAQMLWDGRHLRRSSEKIVGGNGSITLPSKVIGVAVQVSLTEARWHPTDRFTVTIEDQAYFDKKSRRF